MNRGGIRLRPTGLWILFGPILGCMWLGAINYSNNLVYAILYLVGALTFVSIFHTWRNLASLEIEHVRAHSAFSGGEVRIEVHLRNSASRPVYGLGFRRQEDEHGRRSHPMPIPQGGLVRVAAGDTHSVELFFLAGRRGRYLLPPLLVRSSFPFGLVHATFRFQTPCEYFVYPALAGEVTLPPSGARSSDGFSRSPNSGDDFAGVRAYSPGESWRHVDWKAYARGRPLSVKQFAGDTGRELWLDADSMGPADMEKRLSQIALWVVTADKSDISYGLRVEGRAIEPGQGAAQVQRALEMLSVSGGRWRE